MRLMNAPDSRRRLTRMPRSNFKRRRSKAFLAELRRQCRLANKADQRDNWRQYLEQAAANGLQQPSDVMADKVLTVPRSVVSPKPFGRLNASDPERVEVALRFWLGL